MKKSNVIIKICLIVGIISLIVGGLIFTLAMTANKWDFGVLASHRVEAKVEEIAEADTVKAITIEDSTAEVKVIYHDEQKITVEGYELKTIKGKLIKSVVSRVNEEGELIVKTERVENQIFEIGTDGKRAITVKIPKDMAIKLKVSLSTGDVIIGEKDQDYTFNEIDVTTSTGDVFINANVTAKSLRVERSTGEVYIDGKVTADVFGSEATTGDLIINASVVAGNIDIEHDTGDVKCNAFITADKFDIETSTGDVSLKLLGAKEDYSLICDISTGKSNPLPYLGGNKLIEIEISTGDLDIVFEKGYVTTRD